MAGQISQRAIDNGVSNMVPTSEKLILFTRYPRPGQVKTRLIAALGATGAADLHRRLTEHALRQALELVQQRAVALEVQFTGSNRQRMTAWLGNEPAFCEQVGGNLGQRLDQAFATAFAAGARSVVIMGSDCPGLNSQILQDAFTALATSDLVLGPAADGGYYLIGLRQRAPALFEGIPWGSDAVLVSTCTRAQRLGLTCRQLITLSDVDRPEDMVHVATFLSSEPVKNL